MTALAERLNGVVLYAQTLDNSGDTLCWHVTDFNAHHTIHEFDSHRAEVIHRIDAIEDAGRSWLVNTPVVKCRVLFNGDCLLTITPVTLDASGRNAPVQVLFNVYARGHVQWISLLRHWIVKIKRDLSADVQASILEVDKVLQMPWPVIALHVVLFSRKLKDD